MDIKSLTAFYGVLGTIIGVSATVTIAWINQKAQHRRELLRDEIDRRETLYGEFIAECARLLMDAFQHSLEKAEAFVPVYALVNRILLCASQPVLAEAEQVVMRITEQYFSNNLSMAELRRIATSEDTDPLKAFGEACRAELKDIRARA